MRGLTCGSADGKCFDLAAALAADEAGYRARAVLVLFVMLFVAVMGLLYTSMHFIDSDRAKTVGVQAPRAAP